MEEGRPLQNMAEAFKELSNRLNEFPEGEEAGLEVAAFVKACSSVSPLIRCLGGAFLYAEIEYVSKVKDLEEASKSVSVVAEMIDEDVRSDCVRKAGSHTRNLLRLKRVLDMINILFEKIISTEGNSLKDQAIEAFSVFSSHHGFTIRKDVTAGMFDAFPTRAQLLIKLNEDESSSRIEMQKFISSAAQVGEYLDQLFNTRGLGTDW